MYTKSDLWRLWLELFWLEFEFKAKVFVLVPGGNPYNGRGGSARQGYLLQASGIWKGREGKSLISVCVEKGPKGLTDAFYGCEKIEKTF